MQARREVVCNKLFEVRVKGHLHAPLPLPLLLILPILAQADVKLGFNHDHPFDHILYQRLIDCFPLKAKAIAAKCICPATWQIALAEHALQTCVVLHPCLMCKHAPRGVF